jgi:hypothetical protein
MPDAQASYVNTWRGHGLTSLGGGDCGRRAGSPSSCAFVRCSGVYLLAPAGMPVKWATEGHGVGRGWRRNRWAGDGFVPRVLRPGASSKTAALPREGPTGRPPSWVGGGHRVRRGQDAQLFDLAGCGAGAEERRQASRVASRHRGSPHRAICEHSANHYRPTISSELAAGSGGGGAAGAPRPRRCAAAVDEGRRRGFGRLPPQAV